MTLDFVQKITVFAIPLIFAITVHEAAHAFAAKRFGDATAYMLGRMTLNPLKHIDPVWTIVVPLLTLLLTPFVFGAAKPVPVNFDALRNPKRDMIWVAAAGPGANLAMMLAWAVIGKLAGMGPETLPLIYLELVAKAGIFVNALLMIFNLFPLLPLDGGRILVGLLPSRAANVFARTEPYGMFILIALMLSGVLGWVLWPLVGGTMDAVYSVLGLR
ncbi:MAG: site-2 protease family protein [Burkholderiales bacterium]|jgi:Zn-dependent protease|nr:site-2 protease family protein [Nitrosomonadaceae bacterium]